MKKRWYELTVAGCTRRLPILNISDTSAIAAFVILGDVELTRRAARELSLKVPQQAAYIMTAETKGIPLAAALAECMGHSRYIVARKSVKAYMEDPIWVEDQSITTQGKQRLYLSSADVETISGKHVLLVDDVISTGGSMRALAELAQKAGAVSVGQAAILAEGKAAQRKDIIFLETLPLFSPL